MTNKPRTSADSLDAQVGQAWSYHYKRQNDLALAEFQKLAEQDPAHIDANYGLALTLAALGQKERAAEIFKRTAELVTVKLDAQQPEDEDSRYRMLSRMIEQQIEALNRD